MTHRRAVQIKTLLFYCNVVTVLDASKKVMSAPSFPKEMFQEIRFVYEMQQKDEQVPCVLQQPSILSHISFTLTMFLRADE